MRSKTAGNAPVVASLAVAILVCGPSTPAAEGRLLWSTPSQARPTESGGGQPPEPVVADGPEPVVADGIVAWSTGKVIHAVRLDDGTPLTPSRGPRESTAVVSLTMLFPEVVPPLDARLSRPCLHAGRLFATVTASARGGGRAGRLFAIDCSPAGGGRIEWFAGIPSGAVGFEGPPWVDGERVLSLVGGDGGRATPRLAAFDLFDGRLLETRPATEHDRPPAAGRVVPAGRGRFVVATERTIECRTEENARR
jgi:hypothetical protein